MKHIYAVGETILDIIFRDGQPQAAKPGGSSFNASISLGRLGAPITFISEMGNDRVGDLIEDFMESNGVDAGLVSRYDKGKSAIALAFLNHRSDAEYEFYKDYPHQRLQMKFPDIQKDDLLMFGSFYALNPGIRDRMRTLLENARSAGAILVYDPNFRSSHLDQRDELLPLIMENLDYADVIRASDEDLENIFGVADADAAWDLVAPRCHTLIYTANSSGVFLCNRQGKLKVEVEHIEPLSTIGAGDTFNAGILYGIWKAGLGKSALEGMAAADWEPLLKQAAAFSSQVCMSYDNYLPRAYAEGIKRQD